MKEVDTKIQNTYDYLVRELRGFFQERDFERAVIGLSGGIDSAVVACLAADALGPENVLGVTMPSQYSSEGSVKDAEQLAKNLGINFRNIPINEICASYYDCAYGVFNMKGGIFGDPLVFPEPMTDSNGKKYMEVTLAEENLQARVRANILMGFSNSQNALVINTCNLTEDLLGYATMYGDGIGAIAPLGKVGKMGVYKLAEIKKDVIPENTITKPPSAELKPDQTDEKSLPAPYNILDPLTKRLHALIDRAAVDEHSDEIKEFAIKEYGPEYGEDVVKKVYELIVKNEYKLEQAPPAINLVEQFYR